MEKENIKLTTAEISTLWKTMKYGDERQKLLIERGWMEQPPQPIDRNEFYNS